VRGWHPVAIAEYWYGKPKEGNVRLHGRHYPACRGRCLPVLGWMLQGLSVEPPLGGEYYSRPMNEPEIIFENEWFCVVNKPSGMLSVPGKGAVISVQHWLEGRYGSAREIKMAHRLDQDTSGLIIAAFGETSYKTIQALFAMRKVKKQYIAELEGDYRVLDIPPQGRINLPLSPDWLDRPRQRIDFESGKEAVTEYEFISVSEGTSRVRFYPLTGRTHQLRMHAASPDGLGMPIVGDRLYGKREEWSGGRLLLHAHKSEFTFPIDGKHYCFESPVPF
ncbi:MAG: RluA family pseudouridine synthase, partial [Muribaculaceae bacterium]|nr:RluA family pseudouridine synthase [Muribaculaceae bacterium]